jgi:hypothetical protein
MEGYEQLAHQALHWWDHMDEEAIEAWKELANEVLRHAQQEYQQIIQRLRQEGYIIGVIPNFPLLPTGQLPIVIVGPGVVGIGGPGDVPPGLGVGGLGPAQPNRP